MTMTFPIARAATLALIASGFVAAAPVAHAANDKLPSAEIDISKVDFTSPRSVDHLARQVRHVAEAICPADGHYEPGLNSDQRACYTAVIISG